jgi:hypothetical protein
MFYVTSGLFAGNQALTACAAGYHLASYWEIHEPSNFAYDRGRGLRNANYQFGPPVAEGSGTYDPLQAWLDNGRTPASNSNCSGWIDSSGSQGLTAYLASRETNYNTPYYLFGNTDCGEQHHVWCASDPARPFYLSNSTEER